MRVLGVLFEEPDRTALTKRLETEAAENIPFHEKSKPSDMDRIRFSILKLISENRDSEDSVFEVARIDWRDLYMAAGFGFDASEHDKWYKALTGDHGKENPWWRFWGK